MLIVYSYNMNITGTLNMDINPRDAADGTWAYARNMLLSNGYMSMENEGGFNPNVIDLNGRILGWISTPKGVVLFIKPHSLDVVVIYLYNSETHDISDVVSIPESIFPNSYIPLTPESDLPLISGVYTFNYKGELIVVWCNGILDESNPVCIINIDSPPVIDSLDDIEFNTNLFDARIIAKADVSYSGNLKSGNYSFGVSFQREDGTTSSSTLMSLPVSLLEVVNNAYVTTNENHIKAIDRDTIVKCGINLQFQTRYSGKVQLNVLFDNGIVRVGYSKKNISITPSTVIRLSTLDDFVLTPLEDILLPTNPFTHTNNLTSVNIDNASQLLMGGVRFDGSDLTWEQGQRIANATIIEVIRTAPNLTIFHNPTGVASGSTVYPFNVNIPFFELGEVYALYIMLRSKKGSIIGIWHIPAMSSNIKAGDIFLSSHENANETYPVYFPTYNGQKVKHFKIAETVSSSFGHHALNAQVLSLRANINIPNDIDTSNIGEVSILYAKRNFSNHRVIGNDILHSFEWHNRHSDNIATPRTNLSGKWRGHCFDLKITQTSIETINEIEVFYYHLMAGINVYNNNGNRTKEFYQNTASFTRHSTNKLTLLFTDIDRINYLPHDTLIEDNMKGESCVLVSLNTSGKNKLLSHFESLIGISTPITSSEKIGIKYISNKPDYYLNYETQELVLAGKVTYIGNNLALNFYGDVYKNNDYCMRLTKLIETTDENKDENAVRCVFRMFSQGIFNSTHRIEGLNSFEKLGPFTEWQKLTNIDLYPASRDNYLNSDTGLGYNMGYARRNDYYQGVSKESDLFVKSNPNFIARSDIYSSETSLFNWRTFRVNNYYVMPFNMGLLVLLVSDGFNLYIQLQNELFIANVKNVLNGDGADAVYLGGGDIFDRPPRPLVLSQEGHIGCNNRIHAALTPYGYFVVDEKRKRVILVQGDTPVSISDVGLRNYFNDTLGKRKDIRVSYDEEYNRLFVHFGSRNFRIDNDELKILGESVSYSVVKKAWTSFHDYYIDYPINNNKKCIYLLQDYTLNEDEPINQKLTVFTPNANYGRLGRELLFNAAIIENSFVDIYFTKEILHPKLLQSLVWKSISDKDNVVNYEDTLVALIIYNDTQCMTTRVLSSQQSFYDTETAILTNGIWYFNNINDDVINDKLPVISKSEIPLENLIPISNNIRTDKDWFTQSKFITDYAVARLYLQGVNGRQSRKLIINFVDFIYSKDAR